MTAPRLRVVFSHRAAKQIEDAGQWWREHRNARPEALTDELIHALDLVARQPGIGVPAASRRIGAVRRILLPTVGYFLFYRVAPRRKELQVLAFWHARRRPPVSR